MEKNNDAYLSRKEVAELLGVNESTIHRWRKQGKFAAYGLGGRVFFKRREIENSIINLDE